MTAGTSPPSGYQSPQPGYYNNGYASYQPQSYHLQNHSSTYNTTPLIQNPFPLPGHEQPGGAGKGSYDPEYEAQLAQWQSAYVTKEDTSTARNSTKRDISYAVNATSNGAGDVAASDPTSSSTRDGGSKPLTVVRHGGGKRWEDATLLEWGDDPRLFVGNLAGEVTDDSLLKAFAKYNASKARVIRDKRTTKSKGYGFVSFKNADDFFTAAKEMVGKYIGSHPVTIKKAEKISTPSITRDISNKHSNKNRKNIIRDGHAKTGAGVRKSQKPKGPKMLG